LAFASVGVEPIKAEWVARPAPDTVRASVPAGETLILPLPSVANERDVTEYRMARGPALSGVAGRSFTWITRGTEAGTYDVLLQARHPETAPDTLVVRVDVQS